MTFENLRSFIEVHKYLFLLLSFVVLFIIYPLTFGHMVMMLFMQSYLVLALLFVSYFILGSSKSFLFNLVLSVFLILTFPLMFYAPNSISYLLMLIASILFYVFNIVVFVNDITHKSTVTQDIIIGSLCLYLMIALLYAGIYEYLEVTYPGSFEFNTSPIESHVDISFNLAYFSFTTLTTVGFGDIVPHGLMAKSIVVLEQISGIFYLAVLVSRLVSTHKD